MEPDTDGLATVQRVFDLSASGHTDAQVAAVVGLPPFTVRGMLTSPLYIGRLRDGATAHWPPLVDQATWERAQASRARRATNTGRHADPRRPYALSRLYCAACGIRLTGDSGYYRHRSVCAAFVAARPPGTRPGRGRSAGHAYPLELYEQIVEGILAEASLRAPALAAAVGAVVPFAPRRDDTALARIARERDAAPGCSPTSPSPSPTAGKFVAPTRSSA